MATKYINTEFEAVGGLNLSTIADGSALSNNETKALFLDANGDIGHRTVGSAAFSNTSAFASSSHSHAFSAITSKPTTLAGYGITDAASASDLSTTQSQLSSHTHAFSAITNKPTTVAGYGITDAVSTSTLTSYAPKASPTFTGTLTAERPVLINGAHDNGGKADFAVDGGTQISLYDGQVQMGGSDMNWNAKFYYDSTYGTHIGAWDNNITIFSTGTNSGTAAARDIIFKPQISGTAAATERMRIKGNGNVGIGTTTPAYKLHVGGKSYFQGGVQVDSGNKIDFGNSNQYITGVNDTSLTLATGGSATLTATHAGNVGIGTTSPNKNLTVRYSNNSTDKNNSLSGATAGVGLLIHNDSGTNGSYANLDFRSASADGRILYSYNGTANSGDFHFITDNTTNFGTKLFIGDSGNVGIGTTSPSGKLNVVSSSTIGLSDLSNASVLIGSSSAGIGIDTNEIVSKGVGTTYIGTIDANDLILTTNADSSRFVIKSNGNIGINDQTPSYKLDINGTLRTTGEAYFNSNVNVTGDLKLIGTDSYIWTPNTTSGYTGFWDQANSRISLKYRNDYGGWGVRGEPANGVALKVHGTSTTTGAATFDSDVTIGGDLTVNGTTTTLDTATLQVEDHNIEIGNVTTPSNTTANNGGITLLGGTDGDKKLTWTGSSNSWIFNTNLDVQGDFAATGSVKSEGPDGGMVMRTWTGGSGYGMIGTANMSGSEYCLLTNGTDTLISGGSGGSVYLRGGGNDASPQLRVTNDYIILSNIASFPTEKTALVWGASGSIGYRELGDNAFNSTTIPSAANNATITLQGGGGITTTIGDFTTDQSTNETLTISHADTSSQSSVNNSNGTVIQDVTLDTYGHVTGLASANLDDRYARRYEGSASNISSSGYTTVATVSGGSLMSAIRMTVGGTANNVVVANVLDIIVNHSQDIQVEALSGNYTRLYVKIISNNDDAYAIQVKTNNANAVTLYFNILALHEETVTFTSSHSYTGATLEVDCESGKVIKGTGGDDGDIKSHGVFRGNGSGLSNVDADTLDGQHASAFSPVAGSTSLTTAGTLTVDQLNMRDAGDYITFYGDDAANHSIGARNTLGDVADDIRINSYGAVYINLDSNNNNSDTADFRIGRHGGNGTISDWLFEVSGETGNLDVTGDIDLNGNDLAAVNSIAIGNSTIYNSGDSNNIHFSVPTAIIPHSTTTSNNASIGTGTYRWNGLYTTVGNFSSDVTVSGDLDVGSVFDFNTSTDLLTITNNQNTGGINLSGGNSRIYFGGYRAIEGDQSGGTLYIGEGYGTVSLMDDTSVTGDLTVSGTVDIGGKLDIGVSTNYGTTTTADKLWISSFTTGQSDVPGSYYDIINLSSSSKHGIQIASNYGASSGDLYMRTRSDNTAAPAGQGLQAWNKLWHNNNDGSGSGLDADTLDGQHASAFLTGNQSITLSGHVTGSGTTSIATTIDIDAMTDMTQNISGADDELIINDVGSGGGEVKRKRFAEIALSAFNNDLTVDNVSAANLKSRLAAFTSADTVYIGDADDDTTVVIRGTLQVDGTTTTVNSTTVTVDDKNIELGSVASPTDATANGGGITLKGATDKTITWNGSSGAWELNQNVLVGGRLSITTTDTNTSSTSALVLNGTEVEKRTLGSAAFAATTDFAAASNSTTKKISGDGSTTTFTVTHSFGTPIVMTQILDYGDNGTGATYEVINATVKRNSDNAIDIVFGTAPTTTEDYLVLMTKMPAIS